MTDVLRPKVGLVSCYFPLFEKQMPAGFRQDREATARGYAELLARDFDVVDAGTLASDADGERANALLREARPDVVVFAPSMAAPPSYVAHALAGLEAPLVIWNAPTIDRLPDGLTQAQATVNSSQVAAVMLANPLVREARPFATVTASPSDADDTARLVRTRARGRRRVRPARSLGPARRPLAARLPGRGVDRGRARAARRRRARRRRRGARRGVRRRSTRSGSTAGSPTSTTAAGTRREGPADERSMRLALALHDLAGSVDAVAATVNCHSEVLRWNPRIGITACLGASLLTAEGIPVSCTGDLPTALALVLARALSGRALYCEFYTPERETGLMLLAAGGEGDPAWADPRPPGRRRAERPLPGRPRRRARRSRSGSSRARRRRSRSRRPATRGASPGRRARSSRRATTRWAARTACSASTPGSAFEAGARWIASGATHHNALARGRLDVEIPVLARALGIEEVRV